MANIRNLRSFVDERTRKLEAKMEAVAMGDRYIAASTHLRKEAAALLDPRTYLTILERKCTPKTEPSAWPMHYEMTPFD